ncbi:hypothetical protein BO70DRAFT_218162 [Aspergillus heteromorphus CBS 117.55]|uniref:Uncharacterized protein n=1 Tax=Aspergillus heteromorphus CBS 117.55 TaxID=1448321 RepID=A0A317WJW2_9EURO|nr:uncharacterized protein BO70DRAFT_218162 [Aspergillus heteromorphus CBS 117.55]PWY85961.1 hypothetical protein BO70DRAFT_218162 [Aspergillus heteromorphus CBS 117.55]
MIDLESPNHRDKHAPGVSMARAAKSEQPKAKTRDAERLAARERRAREKNGNTGDAGRRVGGAGARDPSPTGDAVNSIRESHQKMKFLRLGNLGNHYWILLGNGNNSLLFGHSRQGWRLIKRRVSGRGVITLDWKHRSPTDIYGQSSQSSQSSIGRQGRAHLAWRTPIAQLIRGRALALQEQVAKSVRQQHPGILDGASHPAKVGLVPALLASSSSVISTSTR